jgi:2-polyprenyl-3-methyl-5-hydroxy-6-metoxy-1,4-benzoquinol methylase
MDLPNTQQDNIALIGRSMFPWIAGGSVLELGPSNGSFFTELIASQSSGYTGVELDSDACLLFRKRWPKLHLVEQDWAHAVRAPGRYDCVVLFGVLTHTSNPLGLLEDIVQYVKPNRILLESEPGGTVRCVQEELNAPGQGQALRPHSGLSIQLGIEVYRYAMMSLGYVERAHYPGPPAGFKSDCCYSVFERV